MMPFSSIRSSSCRSRLSPCELCVRDQRADVHAARTRRLERLLDRLEVEAEDHEVERSSGRCR